MSKYGITYGERYYRRKGFPLEFVEGVVLKKDGEMTAKLTRDREKAAKAKRKPNRIVEFLEVWRQRKYPRGSHKFRPHKFDGR